MDRIEKYDNLFKMRELIACTTTQSEKTIALFLAKRAQPVILKSIF